MEMPSTERFQAMERKLAFLEKNLEDVVTTMSRQNENLKTAVRKLKGKIDTLQRSHEVQLEKMKKQHELDLATLQNRDQNSTRKKNVSLEKSNIDSRSDSSISRVPISPAFEKSRKLATSTNLNLRYSPRPQVPIMLRVLFKTKVIETIELAATPILQNLNTTSS